MKLHKIIFIALPLLGIFGNIKSGINFKNTSSNKVLDLQFQSGALTTTLPVTPIKPITIEPNKSYIYNGSANDLIYPSYFSTSCKDANPMDPRETTLMLALCAKQKLTPYPINYTQKNGKTFTLTEEGKLEES